MHFISSPTGLLVAACSRRPVRVPLDTWCCHGRHSCWSRTRGLTNSDGLRLLIFPQPLGEALKNQNAAPTIPPCFSRRLRSSLLHWADCLRRYAPPPCSSPFHRANKKEKPVHNVYWFFLVRVVIQNFSKTIVVQFVFEVIG